MVAQAGEPARPCASPSWDTGCLQGLIDGALVATQLSGDVGDGGFLLEVPQPQPVAVAQPLVMARGSSSRDPGCRERSAHRSLVASHLGSDVPDARGPADVSPPQPWPIAQLRVVATAHLSLSFPTMIGNVPQTHPSEPVPSMQGTRP
jgi:hypothetical protein